MSRERIPVKQLFKHHFSLRTADLAKILRTTHDEADKFMEPYVRDHEVVTCTVIKNSRKTTEYRKVGTFC